MVKLKIISGLKRNLPSNVYNQMLELRYRVYLEEGFIKLNKNKKFEDSYDIDAIHFIAVEDSKVVGSLSLAFGKSPMDSLFSKEKYRYLRKNKMKKYAEITKFVVRKNYRFKGKKKSLDITASTALIRTVAKYLFKKKIKFVFIAVHPKYEKRYIERYGFKKISKIKEYPDMNNNLAVLLCKKITLVKHLIGKFLKLLGKKK